MNDCCLQCDCDRCLGYSCEPDPEASERARAFARPEDPFGKRSAERRHYIQLLGGQPAPDPLTLPKFPKEKPRDKPVLRGLLALTEEELDELERKAS